MKIASSEHVVYTNCVFVLTFRTIFVHNMSSTDNLKMKFWCLHISQKANQILDRFLAYEPRAEICQKFGWLFGRFEDTKISF